MDPLVVEEGISTTDIVGRLLLLTQDHHTDLVAASEQGVFAWLAGGHRTSVNIASK